MIGLIVAVLLAQQPLQSITVPPASEPRIVFTYKGETFLVGRDTGAVYVVGTDSPAPPEALRPSGVIAGKVYDAVMSKQSDLAKRRSGSTAITTAANATLAQIGGLALGPQAAVDEFTRLCEVHKVSDFWPINLGTILNEAKITTTDAFVQALSEMVKAADAIKK